jgi:O-antigen ligase
MDLNKIRPDIFNFHLLFTAVLMAMIPYAVYIISWAIAAWLLTAIILMIKHREIVSKFRWDFGLVISYLLYLTFVAGVFYSDNQAKALFDIQVKMSLFIFPVIIFLLRGFYKKHFNFVMFVFVMANMVAGLLCLIVAFSHSLQFVNGTLIFNSTVPGFFEDIHTPNPSYFKYSLFSLFKHPAYYSMYLLLCVFYIIYLFRNSIFILKSSLKSKILYIAAISFFILIIYFLESKAAYLSLLLLMLIYFISYIILKKKWIWGIVIISVIVVIGIIGFTHNSRFYYIKTALKNNNGFVEAIQTKNYKVLIDTYGIDRIPIWMISTEIINENFWVGVGSGDVSDVLMRKYKEYKLEALVKNNYNTHNQYLGTFVALGLIGFVIMIVWLFYPLFHRRSYTKEGFLISIFIGIVSINFLFESALNTIAGVIFVAFFYSFLLFVPGEKSSISKI